MSYIKEIVSDVCHIWLLYFLMLGALLRTNNARKALLAQGRRWLVAGQPVHETHPEVGCVMGWIWSVLDFAGSCVCVCE